MRTRLLLPAFMLLVTACDAQFVDLRPEGSTTPPVTPDGNNPGNPDNSGTGMESVIASGTWEGRASYDASGSADLVMLEDGSFEVRFGSDFSVSRVPGPVVVLSRRDSLAGGIRRGRGDIELGEQAERSGRQSYAIRAGADDRRYVWIYCKPFGLEVGRVELIDR